MPLCITASARVFAVVSTGWRSYLGSLLYGVGKLLGAEPKIWLMHFWVSVWNKQGSLWIFYETGIAGIDVCFHYYVPSFPPQILAPVIYAGSGVQPIAMWFCPYCCIFSLILVIILCVSCSENIWWLQSGFCTQRSLNMCAIAVFRNNNCGTYLCW